MPLQRDLTTIEEHNAAMELTFSGLLGLRALPIAASGGDKSVALRELTVCIELCQMAELALSDDLSIARKNVYFSAAWRRICGDSEEKKRVREQLRSAREALESFVRRLGQEARFGLDPSVVDRLVNDMQSLSERIRQAIPRDASLRSLIRNPPSVNRRQ